jgi:hypothetical protein
MAPPPAVPRTGIPSGAPGITAREIGIDAGVIRRDLHENPGKGIVPQAIVKERGRDPPPLEAAPSHRRPASAPDAKPRQGGQAIGGTRKIECMG